MHLWLDDATKHTETMKTVRTAAVQLQRKASFVYHDMKRDGGKPGDVEEGTRKMLLNYALDGSQPPLLGLDGKGMVDLFKGDREAAYKQYPFSGFSADTTSEAVMDWVGRHHLCYHLCSHL